MILTLKDLPWASELFRQVTLRLRCLQLTPLIERTRPNFVPFGIVSVTVTVLAEVLLLLAAVRVSVKREPRLTDFGADALIAVSTTRRASRSPSTLCPPGGIAKLQRPVDGPTLMTRS